MLYITETYLQICTFAIVLLSGATAVNWFLKVRKPQSDVFSKVHIIIRSWWFIIGTLLVAAAFGPYGFLLLFTILNGLMVSEYLSHSRLLHFKSQLRFLFILGILLQALFLWSENFELFGAFPVLFFLISLPLLVYDSKSLENLPSLAAGFICIVLLTHCAFHFPALILAGPKMFRNYDNTLLMFFIIVGLTQGNDVFQFICGKAFGRRKIVPHLSPNKTEAGFIGGVTLTTLIGGGLFHTLVQVPWPLALLFGFAIATLGIFGDLTLSTLKRHFQIKDFGNSLPGHGGFTDRMDSLIFTGPVLFHIVKFYYGINL